MSDLHPKRRDVLAGLAASACALTLRPAAAQSQVELKPDLAEVFHEARTEGTFAALLKGRMVMTDESRARTGYLPASTFKIPHALIALETGVVADTDKELIRINGGHIGIMAGGQARKTWPLIDDWLASRSK